MKHKGGAFEFPKLFGRKNNGNSLYSMDTYSNVIDGDTSSGIKAKLAPYLFTIFVGLIAILIILVVVHYTIRPIFRFKPGDDGVIGVPGSDDSVRYWQTPSAITEIPDPLKGKSSDWSMGLNIVIDDPIRNTGAPRILFARGGELVENYVYDPKHTILHMFQSNHLPNLVIYLDKLNNDVYVSTVSTTTESPAPISVETVLIPNFPVRRAVRLGVTIQSKFIEVYINGELYKSRTFAYAHIQNNTGNIYAPNTTILGNVARVQYLRLWQRVISIYEFRSDGTPMPMDEKDVQDSCLN